MKAKSVKSFCLFLIVFSMGFITCYVSHSAIQRFIIWKEGELDRFLEKTDLSDLRICLCLSDEEVTFQREDGLEISGSLYGSRGSQKRPGLLLLHGDTPRGRKLALYKVMASKFAAKGYLVLSIDFAGYGESDDPFSLGTREALDLDKDVNAALRFLLARSDVDTNRIYLIGHSMGAGPGLSVGIQHDCVKKIVVIGPPRRLTERLVEPGEDREYFWRRAQRTRMTVYQLPFPAWYNEERWLEGALAYHMEKYLPYFSQPAHKPLLLMDGELEDVKDRVYIMNYYNKITNPKTYITLSESDHYCNTLLLPSLGLVLYDKKVIGQAVSEIDRWLNKSVSI